MQELMIKSNICICAKYPICIQEYKKWIFIFMKI